ncbi:DUF3492 domain-containing protein [Streptomyces sp. NPDC085946]|uniref:DUF3492 domain-containing protein n=1 Tax=Streptomyces sp. NPDC085946 TaxID=3365744 RepID=UPI0037D6F22E
MRIGLLTEGGYPYVGGDATLWCDRLVRGLEQHEFDVYALSRSERQEDEGWVPLPPQVGRVRTAALWATEEDGAAYGRRARRRFEECYGELAAALCAGSPADTSRGDPALEADRFANALYGLADLARDAGGLAGALRSETAVRLLERTCRAPGALRTAREARVPELLTVAAHLERALRPLSLDWYEDAGLGAVDLCHAASNGLAALPGLLARHFCGVPLLVTEYGVQLRTQYLASADSSPAVRSLLAAFHGRLAAETYRRAALVTPGNTHARRWQERCGADRAKLRTVYPGMNAAPFAEVGESARCADPATLVWAGRVEPAKDLVSLLHAFAEIRKEEPGTRLRIVGAPAGPEGAAYLGHCKALAAQLFPDEAEGPHAVGDNPVSFDEIGGPDLPTAADAYASGPVTVLSSVVEGFPAQLVEAMLCARATVSTDVGAVVEVVGGTGLVVPPRNPRALAEACVSLLRDPKRCERLGAAARARALELFTVEQNVEAFRGIYLEIVSGHPVHRVVLGEAGEPLPFAAPAESHVAGPWAGPTPRGVPQWAARGPAHTPVSAPPVSVDMPAPVPVAADTPVPAPVPARTPAQADAQSGARGSAPLAAAEGAR